MSDDLGVQYTDRRVRDIERSIRRIYSQAQKEVEAKTESFFSRLAEREQKMQAKVQNGTMTQEKFDEWKRNNAFYGQSWRTQQENIAEVLARTNKVANDLIRDNQFDVFAKNGNFAGYEFEHGFGANFGFDLYSKESVARLIKDKPNILPFKKLDKEKDIRWNFKNIRSQVTQGILQGESVPKIAKRLAEAVPNRNAKQMVLHARTAMTSAQNGGRMERFKEAEALGIKFKKVWLATLDGRTRDLHAELDGQAVDPKKPFKIGGYSLDYPADPHGAPEMTYNCRCTLITELDDYPAEFTRRVQEDGSIIKDQSYREWEKSKQKKDESGAQAKSAWDFIGQSPQRPKASDYDDYDVYEEAKTKYRKEREEYNERLEQWYQENIDQNPMSVEELKKWCDKNDCAIYGSIEGLDGIALRNYTERFEKLSKDFPIVQEYHKKLGVPFRISYSPNATYGAEASHGMDFGGIYRDFHNTVIANAKNGEGFTVLGENPAVKTFDHEFGHQVYHAMQYEKDAKLGEATEEEIRRRIALRGDFVKSVYGKNGMSEYATTNDDELFAEAFASWYGGEKTDFANAFGEFLKRWL